MVALTLLLLPQWTGHYDRAGCPIDLENATDTSHTLYPRAGTIVITLLW